MRPLPAAQNIPGAFFKGGSQKEGISMSIRINRSKTAKMLVVYKRAMSQYKNNVGERAVMELEPARRLAREGVVEVIAGPLTDEDVAKMGGIAAWLDKNKNKKLVTDRELAKLPAHPHLPPPREEQADAVWEVSTPVVV